MYGVKIFCDLFMVEYIYIIKKIIIICFKDGKLLLYGNIIELK